MERTDFSQYIRNIKDYPKKGIVFRDITTLLREPYIFNEAILKLSQFYKNIKVDKVVAIESRGFITGAALAYNLRAGFVPIRKRGKLPADVFSETYELEYGTDVIEIHKDSIHEGEHIILHDDVLATGGTMSAAVKLVKKLNPVIMGICFLIELKSLKGREKLADYKIQSLIEFD